MYIKKILSKNRNDFWADYACEGCGFVEHDKSGYNDDNYHNNVIPRKVCPACGMTGIAIKDKINKALSKGCLHE